MESVICTKPLFLKTSTKNFAISIKTLALCDQEQLNSIAHLIEKKSVSLNSNPAGFLLFAKDQDNPFYTINDLAIYYLKKTGQSLKMARCLLNDCRQNDNENQ